MEKHYFSRAGTLSVQKEKKNVAEIDVIKERP